MNFMANEPTHSDDLPDAIPVSLLTGFLGSGKTTLLNRLLQHPDMVETAVLINEFGDVSIDHLLVEKLDEDVVLLEGGCVCCSVRGDLSKAMRDLLVRRADKTIPPFRRIIIETTGLADPAPVVHTLITDPMAAGRYRLDGIITTVDALLGDGTLDAHEESVKQIAIAERIVITKTDLADETDIAKLEMRIGAINPGALLIRTSEATPAPADLFEAGLFDGDLKPQIERWLDIDARDSEAVYDHQHDFAHDHDHAHDKAIRTFAIETETPIPWESFTEWLDMLLTTQGDRILRVKGVLNVEGQDLPIAVHGVQHVFHPPAQLPAWPVGERGSKLVFITRDLSAQPVLDTFEKFIVQSVKG